MQVSRRSLLGSAAALAAGGLASCTSVTNPTTGQVTYGLDPSVVTFITTAVQDVAQYAPTVESIAATAASLFGPAYAAIVTAGTAAVNSVISALENLVPSLPVAASARLGAKVKAMAAASPGHLVGYTKLGVPVYSQ